MRLDRKSPERERGNMLVVSFLAVTILTALATAHFATVQKNSRQADYMNEMAELRRHADSGIQLALHEMVYEVGNSDGLIGTEQWTTAGDLGKDNQPSTGDEGEGDGVPTPGEAGLQPAAIGETGTGMRLLVRTADSAWPGVKRIVSTAFNSRAMAIVEMYAQEATESIPGTGAAYLQPGVALDLRGNSFTIDGHDTNPDGSGGPEPTVYGISTSIGDPPGTNADAIAAQIPGGREDQVIGQGSNPSVGETSLLDFDLLFNSFKAARTHVIDPGSYSDAELGDYAASDNRVTVCNGNLQLTGNGIGSGVLVVEGSLTISGTFEFVGVVIVRGDVRIVGGGAGVQIYGSLMIGESLTALDTDPEVGVLGNAKVMFSSVGLGMASGLLGSNYTALYWNVIK